MQRASSSRLQIDTGVTPVMYGSPMMDGESEPRRYV
jgi:hypothetical protein